VAPTEDLREQALVIAELGDLLANLDLEDQDAVDAANARATDPDVLAAAEALTAYTNDECGFDVAIFSSVAGGGSTDGGDEGEAEVDTDAVREELAGSAPDVEANLLGLADIDGTYVASIVGVTATDAVAACDAVSAAFVTVDAGYEGTPIQVADDGATVFAEGEAGSACAAV
jgi:hypothetical protein